MIVMFYVQCSAASNRRVIAHIFYGKGVLLKDVVMQRRVIDERMDKNICFGKIVSEQEEDGGM